MGLLPLHIASILRIFLFVFVSTPALGSSLNVITRFPHQDSTKSNSEAFPLTLLNQTVMFVWAESTAIRYSKSTDSGMTWSQPVQFATPLQYARFLTGIRTLSGRLITFWKDADGVRFTLSDDEGLTWTPTTSLGSSPISLHVSQTDDGKLWLLAGPPLGGTRYMTSTDNGATWSSLQALPVSVTFDACFVNGQGGSLHCIYATSTGQSNIHRITSTDGGATWSPATPILSTTRSEKRPRIARQSNGTILMVYDFQRSDSIPSSYFRSDLYSVRSTDGGITWSSPEMFTRFVGDDLLHDVTMLHDAPFVTFASTRWGHSSNKLWYGIIGETPDDNPPPILLSGSTLHTYSNLENWIRAYVDDESGIAAVRADYSINGVHQPTLQLFDDGLHSDGGPGDNIWANGVGSFPLALIECSFTIVDLTGNTLNAWGFSFTTFPPPPVPVIQGTSMEVASSIRGTFGRAALGSTSGFGLRYPANSTIEHLFAAGLWVGGKIDTTAGGNGERIKRVSTAYEGWSGPYNEFFSSSPSDSIWRIYGTNGTMPPNWEQYWGTGLPFHPLADQNFYNKYNDYTQPVTGHVPMGINVIQSSYTWDDPGGDGIQILDFKIINNSSRSIDSAYVGFFVDGDVGPVEIANYFTRNYSAYIAALRMGLIHNPVDFGSTPLGASVLNTHRQDSLRFTFRWYPGPQSPGSDGSKYDLLSLGTIREDEFPALSDTRFLLSFGPYTLQPRTSPNPDTLLIAFALLSAPDISQLQLRATRARDIYQSITSVGRVNQTIPTTFALDQNYPNPFNSSTKVRFQIAHAAFTTLEVFDILGRRVATLVNEEMKTGVYEADFDASGLASGVYIYSLKAGNSVNVKKALLLR